MRTAWSRAKTKILPSPIWPVLAADVIASTTLSTWSAGDRDLDLELGQEAHGVFGAAVDFRVALLAAVALDLGDGQALDADRRQCVAHLVQLERLDDGHNDFHGVVPVSVRGPSRRTHGARVKSAHAGWRAAADGVDRANGIKLCANCDRCAATC